MRPTPAIMVVEDRELLNGMVQVRDASSGSPCKSRRMAGHPASWQRLVSQFEAKVHSLLTDTVNKVAGRRRTGVAVRLLVRAQYAFYSQPVERHPHATVAGLPLA